MPVVSEAGSAPVGEPAGPEAHSRQQSASYLDDNVTIRVNQHPRQRLQIFRHLEHCTHREVLQDDGSGRLAVESEHLATWRLFGLHGHLRTRLLVEQDHRALTSCFELLHSRFNPLHTFQGRWRVQPQPAERCAQAHRDTSQAAGSGDACCELTIEQELQPAVWLPPPLGGLLRQLACSQLRGVFQDLQTEAAKINAGRPSLWEAQPP
ncbi:hypothetical protein ABPG77_009293 [Micractinium sp. CCAP 211/92]